MAKLSKTAQQFLIDGVASTEWGLEIIAAIEAGGGGSGSLEIGTSPITGGTVGRMLTVGGGSILSQQKIPQSTGPVNAIQTSDGSGSWHGDANFTYNGTNVVLSQTSINQVNFAGLVSNLTIADTTPPGNAQQFAIGGTVTVTDNANHSNDVFGGASFTANYTGTSTIKIMAGAAFGTTNSSTGTMTSAFGMFGQVVNNSTGIITNGEGFVVQLKNNANGSIQNATGMAIQMTNQVIGGFINDGVGINININDNSGGANIHGGAGVVVVSNGVSMAGFVTSLTGSGGNTHFLIKSASLGDVGLNADINGVTNLVREMQFMNQGAAKFWDNANTGSIAIAAPISVTGYILTLPAAVSSNINAPLISDNFGNLNWGPVLNFTSVTPTITLGSNCTAASPIGLMKLSQVGNIVTGSLQINATSAAGGDETILYISIPIGGVFVDTTQGAGTGVSGDLAGLAGVIQSNPTEQQLVFIYNSVDAFSHSFSINFTYQAQ